MSKVTISAKRTSEKEATNIFRELAKQTTPEDSIEELIQELRLFEKKFSMGSMEFYRKFNAGKMGDSEDIMLWAMYYESYLSLMNEYLLPKAVSK